MIISVIFLLHIIFLIYIFIDKSKKESKVAGFLNVIFIITLFAIGWSILTLIVNLIFDENGFGYYFNRDTITLTLLTIAEYYFYKIYYKNEKIILNDKEK